VGKKFVVVLLVLVLSAILVGSVYAGPGVSGRFSVGSLLAEITVTELQGRAPNGLIVSLDTSLTGFVLCADQFHSDIVGAQVTQLAVSDSQSVLAHDIRRGRRASLSIELSNGEINHLLPDPASLCPAGTSLVKLRIDSFTATLTAEEINGNHPFLASATYECTVNYDRQRHGAITVPASCHLTSEQSS
jgi:hypothetical protein